MGSPTQSVNARPSQVRPACSARSGSNAKCTARSRQAGPQASDQGFAELTVVGVPSGPAVIVLPQNIRIELASVPQINAAIVREVLQFVCRADSMDSSDSIGGDLRC